MYHLSAKIISRNMGQAVEAAAYRSGSVMVGSAVKAAAYRSGQSLETKEDGKLHDYSRKEDVLFTEILAPEGAAAWVQDRQTLWNTVEKAEKRKDAQLAREVEVALPRELSLDQCKELLRGFIGREFLSRGMVADIAIHSHEATDGWAHIHAHILLTMRTLTTDGFGQKVREWNDKALLKGWRESWAQAANAALTKAGHEARLDHRTLKAQGAERAPQETRGKVGNKLYKAGLEPFQASSTIAKEIRIEEVRAGSRLAYQAAQNIQRERQHNYAPKGLEPVHAPRWTMQNLLWQWLGNSLDYAVDWAFQEMRIPLSAPLHQIARHLTGQLLEDLHPEPLRRGRNDRNHSHGMEIEL